MSNTLKIKIPEGFEIDSFDASTCEIKFKAIPKDIKERIQSIADIFALNNTTKEDFETKWKGFEPHEVGNALEILIVSAYNEGKLPDFTDDTSKYYPLFSMSYPLGVGFSYHDFDSWFMFSTVGARLIFHGKEAKANMLDAANKFLPEYKKSRTT